MQAVILAAGRGTRMGVLTETLPKPMLTVCGKTLLEHKFDALPASVEEIVLVVGYLHETIRDAYGASYGGRSIRYVQQQNIVGGTADALWCAKELLLGRFLVMMGDDIYATEDVESVARNDWALLVEELPDLGTRGCVDISDGRITGIREHEEHGGGRGFASTNLFVLDTRLFAQPLIPRSAGHREYGLPQTVVAAAHTIGIPLAAVPATRWIQITAPEDLRHAESILST